MKVEKIEPLNESELERIKRDLNFREAIGFEAGRDEGTISEWAKYKNHLFKPAIIKFIRGYMAKHPQPIEQEA